MRVIGLALALVCVLAVGTAAAEKWSYGVDLSTLASVQALQCMKQAKPNAIDYIVFRGGRSTGKPDPNIAQNLKNAQSANYASDQLGVYLFPCPKCELDGAGQVKAMMDAIEKDGASNLFSTIWLDIEGGHLYWKTPAENVKFIDSMIKQAKTYLPAKKIGFYTAKSQWSPIVGTHYQASEWPIWYAQYNRHQNFDDFQAFAGWTIPAVHQYAGDVALCGVGVDMNVMKGGGRTLLQNTVEHSVPNGGVAPTVPDLNPACTASKGTCIDTSQTRCVGTLKSRLCPSGGAHILCCVPRDQSSHDANPGCTAVSGTCIDTTENTCNGKLKRRLCPSGGDNVLCCVGSYDRIGAAPSPACTDAGGMCQLKSKPCDEKHGQKIIPGVCANSAAEQCCVHGEGFPSPLPPPPPPSHTPLETAEAVIKRLKVRSVPPKKVAPVSKDEVPKQDGDGPVAAGAAPAPLNTAQMGGESMGSVIRREDPAFDKRLPNHGKQ